MSVSNRSATGAGQDERAVYDRGEMVCVIGAGASGLLAIKNLREHGFGVDCYDRETGVGGAWHWRHDRSPIYAGMHVISSRQATSIPDFPMPDEWPDYPHHSQVATYLERYAEHFDLRKDIWFGTEVVRVAPDPEGRWQVTTRSTGGGTERTHRYAAVVVANGHNWSPHRPSYEGSDQYAGELVHASSIKDPAILRNRRVLVVGGGNTGCDLAVEAAQYASVCWHASNRGYWYVPKFLFGRPVDQVHAQMQALRLPVRIRQWLFHRILALAVGDLRRFGLPRPDHRIFETHPIINSQLVQLLGHGRITAIPPVARLHTDSVELVDGNRIDPDLVVLATGYRPCFEFVDPSLLNIDEQGRPRLSLHMFSPQHPTLMVAGLLQSDGALFPLVHWQTVVIARWLRLRERDPARAASQWSQLCGMLGRRWTDVRVTDSARHWFEVAQVRYLRSLQRILDELEETG